jgi:hypothetical protein
VSPSHSDPLRDGTHAAIGVPVQENTGFSTKRPLRCSQARRWAGSKAPFRAPSEEGWHKCAEAAALVDVVTATQLLQSGVLSGCESPLKPWLLTCPNPAASMYSTACSTDSKRRSSHSLSGDQAVNNQDWSEAAASDTSNSKPRIEKRWQPGFRAKSTREDTGGILLERFPQVNRNNKLQSFAVFEPFICQFKITSDPL